MTVSTTTTFDEASGTGAVTDFPFTFVTQDASTVKVYLNDMLQSFGYTVSLNSNQTSSPGGTVTFGAAPGSGVVVYIERDIPKTQPLALAPYGVFSATAIEEALDRKVLEIQELDRDLAAAAVQSAADLAAESAALSTQIAMARGTNPYEAVSDSSTVLAAGSTTARTMAARFADTINVKDFGALGDGSTDDTAAIQAAFDEAATRTNGCEVWLPAGVYMVSSLDVPTNVSIQGDGIRSTVIKMKNGANAAAVLQTEGFAALTGTTSTGGTFRTHWRDFTAHGNKDGNPSGGNCARIYGKGFAVHNVTFEEAKTVGLYTEYGGVDFFGDSSTTLEAGFRNLSIQQCGGTGWVSKGPHDQIVAEVVIFNCGGWGWDLQTPAHANAVNTFLCTSGGIKTSNGGCITGGDIAGTTGTGHGFLVEAGSGANIITGGTYAGGIALELRSTNQVFHGQAANTSVTCVKLNGGSGLLQLTMFGNTGNWFDVAGQNGGSTVTVAAMDGSGTLFSGAPAGNWLVSGAKEYVQFTVGTLHAGGYAPQLPLSSAVMPATDVVQTWGASQAFAEIRVGWTGGPTITSGTGSPEGVVTAPVGSLFVRTDGGAGTTLYVKQSGAGNTGWGAK